MESILRELIVGADWLVFGLIVSAIIEWLYH